MGLKRLKHRCGRSAGLVAVAAALAWAAAPARAAADPALLDAARRAQPAVVESLKDMVMIESGSANAEGLTKMADYTERRLKELGAQTERMASPAGAITRATSTSSSTRSCRAST